jgi:hypothetical protein
MGYKITPDSEVTAVVEYRDPQTEFAEYVFILNDEGKPVSLTVRDEGNDGSVDLVHVDGKAIGRSKPEEAQYYAKAKKLVEKMRSEVSAGFRGGAVAFHLLGHKSRSPDGNKTTVNGRNGAFLEVGFSDGHVTATHMSFMMAIGVQLDFTDLSGRRGFLSFFDAKKDTGTK